MNDFIKKNINPIIAIFVLLGPILDLITGVCLHSLGINLTLGIIVRVLFLGFICIITLFTFKKKNILIPYLIIGLYFILYTVGMIIFKDTNIFVEVQNLVKVFYFPIILISLYSIKDEIKISNMTLFTVLFLYLILLFIPTLFNLGYDTYEIAKTGTLGFFNSANEISGIISILTPIMFIILFSSKNIIPKIILALLCLFIIILHNREQSMNFEKRHRISMSLYFLSFFNIWISFSSLDNIYFSWSLAAVSTFAS